MLAWVEGAKQFDLSNAKKHGPFAHRKPPNTIRLWKDTFF
jgi:hypothetical protein